MTDDILVAFMDTSIGTCTFVVALSFGGVGGEMKLTAFAMPRQHIKNSKMDRIKEKWLNPISGLTLW